MTRTGFKFLAAAIVLLTATALADDPPKYFDLPKRAASVKLDGKLDEWKNLPCVCDHPAQILHDRDKWKGPADASFRFAVEYDDDYLYIAIESTDDKVIADPSREAWDKNDGIEVRVDCRPEAQSRDGRGANEMDDFLLIGLVPGDKPADTHIYKVDALPDGFSAVCVKSDKGFNSEIAIPISYIQQKQGADWKTVRINVAQDDIDEPGGPMAQIWWQPDWRTDQNIAGSGMFRR